TALQHRGIQMVIAGSFSQTYKRNAFNNGYIVIECPGLVDDIRTTHSSADALTIRTGWQARVDFTAGRIQYNGNTHTFAPLGRVAQELVVKGGFEEVIRDQLAAM
ncbi:MAG: homoaconitase, partial [Phycisphaerae bacterium]